MPPGNGPEPRRARLLARNGMHLFALSGLAIAQPLYDFLGTDPAVLLLYDVTQWALVALALAVALIPPLVLLAVEALAALAGPRVLRLVHLICVAGLVALFVLQARTSVSALPDGAKALTLLAVAVGGGAAALYARFPQVRAATSVLAMAPVAFVLVFLLAGPVSPLATAADPKPRSHAVTSTAPVVMVIFDELPVASLLDRRGAIDAARYPAFARLAREGTWFRNTTTVEAFTPWAIPAILDGRYPRPRAYSDAAFHPRSIFTLLGPRYRMDVEELYTRVCPRHLCPRPTASAVNRAFTCLGVLVAPFWERLAPEPISKWAARRMQDVRRALGGENTSVERALARLFLDVQPGTVPKTRFAQFIPRIRPTRRPTLHLIHAFLPHTPWRRLPTGEEYSVPAAHRPTSGREGTDLLWRRHLLQLEYTDRLLGRLLARLDAQGLYDRALVAVVPDHGIAFSVGHHARIPVPETVDQIAPVPFMIKRPGQRTGEVRDTPMETIDVLPTIADALGIDPPEGVDGASGFGSGRRGLARVRVTAAGRNPVTIARAALDHGVPTMRRRLPVAGAGADRRALYATRGFAGLVGRRVPQTLPLARGRSVELDGRERLRHVDLNAPTIPAFFTGVLRGGPVGQVIAVALNGRVASVARTARSGRGAEFAGIVAASALRDGANDVAFLVARSGPHGPALVARVPLTGG